MWMVAAESYLVVYILAVNTGLGRRGKIREETQQEDEMR